MKLTGSNVSWIGSTTGLTLVVTLPILLIVLYAVGADGKILAHIKETVLLDYITNTALLLFVVSILTLIFGVSSAFLVTFYEFRFRKIFAIGLILPFAVPSYILGFIYSDLFGFFGHVHIFLMSLGIKSYFDIFSFYTASIVLALAFYPYIYLIVRASFLKNAGSLINSALSLGMSKERALFKVVLPLSRVAIFAGLALVMMEVISDYGVVSHYGIKTLTNAIFSTWFNMGDAGSAAYISSIAMAFVLSILLIEKFSQGRAKYSTESSSAPLEKIKLRGVKLFFAYFFLSIPVFFGFILPLIWIIVFTFAYGGDTIDMEFLSAVTNSFIVASLASIAIIVIAVLIAYTYRLIPNMYTKYVTKFATLGYSMPGAVIGIGIIILFGDFDNYLIDNHGFGELLLSGTLFALVFGYIVRFLAVGLNSVSSSFEKLGINVNRASRSLGSPPLKTLFRVELPLLRNSLIIAYLLVFIDIVKELPLTLILRPFNYETLATKTYGLAVIELIQESAVYALCIILLCLVSILFSLKAYR